MDLRLKKQFRGETGFDVFVWDENNEVAYTEAYVEWLEAKINVTHCCKGEAELLKAIEIGDDVICWKNTFAKVIEVKLTGYVCEDLTGFTFMVDNKDVKHKSL